MVDLVWFTINIYNAYRYETHCTSHTHRIWISVSMRRWTKMPPVVLCVLLIVHSSDKLATVHSSALSITVVDFLLGQHRLAWINSSATDASSVRQRSHWTSEQSQIDMFTKKPKKKKIIPNFASTKMRKKANSKLCICFTCSNIHLA